MNIKINDKKERVDFCDLSDSTVFADSLNLDRIFIKIPEGSNAFGRLFNAVNIVNANLSFFDPKDSVYEVDGCFVVNGVKNNP